MNHSLYVDIFLEVMLAIVYVIPTSYFRYRPFTGKFRFSIKKHSFLYCAFFALSNAMIIHFHMYDSFTSANKSRFILYLCMSVFSFYLVKEHIGKQIYIICYFGNFTMFASAASLFVESFLFPHEASNLLFKLIAMLVTQILAFPFIYRFFYKPLASILDKSQPEIWNILWLSGVIQLMLNAFLSIPYNQNTVSLSMKNAGIRLSISTGSIIINVVAVVLIKKMNDAIEKNKALEAEKQQLVIQDYQYRSIQEKIEESRRFRHDFKHHIKYLQAILDDPNLSDEDKTKKLAAYGKEYFGTIPESEELRFTENYTLNLILNYYHNEAEDKKCSFSANINVPSQMAIKDTDLCVLVGNLLLNAQEAAAEVFDGARKINVNITKEGRHLLIMVENTFNGQLNQSGDIYFSTKHSGAGHGITNIQSITSRYSGSCYFDHQENVFSARVHLVLEY